MVFDGTFHLPSWCVGNGPEHLIRHCQLEIGAASEPSVAAIALATWITDDPERAKREAARPGSPLSMGGVITRLLAGEIEPSGPLAESLGQMTAGAVRFEDFGRTGRGVALEAVAVPEPSAPPRATTAGVLGETPPGPLFSAGRAQDGAIEVRGLGLTFRLGRSGALALRDQLGRALGMGV
jgi:hypothetical protein